MFEKNTSALKLLGHSAVIRRVDIGQVFEDGVVRRGRILGKVNGGIVERIRSDDRAAVKIRRQHEGSRRYPLHHSQRLRWVGEISTSTSIERKTRSHTEVPEIEKEVGENRMPPTYSLNE